MITWHSHTDIPAAQVVAMIASRCPLDGKPFLLPNLYRYSEPDGCWIGENTGLPLKQAAFVWAKESDILETLP